MAFDPHANLIDVTVTVAPSTATAGTTLSISDSDAAALDAAGLNPSTNGAFNASVAPSTARTPANTEIIRLTAKGTSSGGNTQYTIARQTEAGGVNRSIVVGDVIKITITKKTITDIETSINAKCRVHLATTMSSVVNGTEFQVTLDTVDFDPGSNWDSANHKFVVPVDGYYLINACASLPDGQAISGGRWASEIRKNGANIQWTISHLSNVNGEAYPVSGVFHLTAADVIELYAYNLTGGSAGVVGGSNYTYMDIHLLSV